MTEEIARAVEPEEKNRLVEKLKDAIRRGEIEAQSLDATNPERHRMMEAWCASSDEASSKAKKHICKRADAHKDFVARRQTLVDFWCGEMGHAGSPKCQQMEYGKRMHATATGAERLQLATEFKASQTGTSSQSIEEETREMMGAICKSNHGKTPIFLSTCSRPHSEL